MKKKIRLSIVLAVYNEEKNIAACLKSTKGLADEIIVIDGYSQDRTKEIAQKFAAKVYQVSNKLMFHKNKQLGLEKAQGEWILQLDADERLTKKLKKEIKTKIISEKIEKINGFYLPRRNYFLGRFLRKGGQYPDYVIRLIRKNKAFFPCKSVHEQIKVKGKTDYLKNPLLHFSTPNLAVYWQKASLYTQETALKLKKNKIKINLKNILNFYFFKPLIIFFKIYIRHKGFLDSWQGFLFALFSALHPIIAFTKYLKLKKNI